MICYGAQIGYVSFTGNSDESLLEQKDVKIEFEGKEAPIKEFFYVDTLHPKQKTLQHPAGRRQHIVVLDLVLSKPEDILKARTWMNDLALKAPPQDLFAMAAITQTDGLRWFCHLTSDRNQIRAGWNSVLKGKPNGFAQGPEGNLYSAKFESTEVQPISDEAFTKNLSSFAPKASDQDRLIVIQGLVDIAYLLSTMEGRKNVYLFSPGFDAKGLSINLDLEKRKKQEKQTASDNDPATFDSMTNSVRDIEEVAKQGPSTRRTREVGAEIIPDLYSGTDAHVHAVSNSEERNGFLEEITSKTGGVYFTRNFDVDRVLNTDRFYYVAGWEEGESDKTLNSLKVIAEGREIQAPHKWLIPKYFEEYTPEEKKSMISEAIFKDYGTPSANINFWADFYFEEGLNKIPVFTQISGDTLLKGSHDSSVLEVYGYVLDSDQRIVDFRTSVVEMDLTNKKLRERLQKSGLKVWQVLLGSTKPMKIRWIVLDSQTGEVFTHSMTLDVKENEMTMTNPFVPSTDMEWIIWPKPTDQISHRGVSIRYPYNMDGGVFFPDLAPVINPENKSNVVYFKIYNLLPESPNPPVRFHLLDPQGKASEIDKFQLLRKPLQLEHQGLELFWNVNAFPSVQPGEYRFRVDIKEPAGKSGIAGEIAKLQLKES
ncbi:MAG TPA: hypothetical protein VLH08_06205 [Acidobacteriota bacterium]|nr:hypothetical protein [Acidobacteriota bacterium]